MVIPGAQMMFRIVSSVDWYSVRISDRFGGPNACAIAPGSEIARAVISRIALSGEDSCRAPAFLDQSLAAEHRCSSRGR
jgi:hypothetical protein